MWARYLAPLAALLVLTSCANGVAGRPVAVRALAGGGALEFREVITATSAQPAPAGTPAPQSVARQPNSGPDAACSAYLTDLTRNTVDKAKFITEAKACRQNPELAPSSDGTVQADPTAQQAALATLNCASGFNDPLAGNADPRLPLATCDRDGAAKYLLSQAFLTGKEVADSRAQVDDRGVGWVVLLSFTSAGSRIWADYTTKNVRKQVAFVLDGAVVSAPTIQEPITGGDTRINGGTGGFTKEQAEQLVDRLHSR